jgi:hypothetical protein
MSPSEGTARAGARAACLALPAHPARGTGNAPLRSMKHASDSMAREPAVAIVHALLGWVVAAAATSLAMWKTPAPEAALSAHAVVLPLAFLLVSAVYFRRAQPLRPLAAALLFAGVVLLMDATVTFALHRTVDARALLLGMWLPACSALLATWAAGMVSAIPGAWSGR